MNYKNLFGFSLELHYLCNKKMCFFVVVNKSIAYDRGKQEIQTDFYGGAYGRDAAGAYGGCGEGCKGVEC